MRVFMTGGTGAIGQHILVKLLSKGHEVVVLTRTANRIPALSEMKGVTLVEGTMFDFPLLAHCVQGCDAVIHLAMDIKSDPYSIVTGDTAVLAFLLTAAERAGVKSFIYTSSVTTIQGPVSDRIVSGVLNEDSPIRPYGVYGASKAAGEAFTLAFHEYFDFGHAMRQVKMRRNAVRPCNVYSSPAFPGGASDGLPLIEKMAEAILKNEDVVFPACEGANFVAGQQIAELYMKILESDVNGEAFICGGKKWMSYIDIAKRIKQMVPESTSKVIGTGGSAHVVMDTGKMERFFGLSFEGDEYLEAHISAILEHLREKEKTGKAYNWNHSIPEGR